MYVCGVMFISKRCSITHSDRTCVPNAENGFPRGVGLKRRKVLQGKEKGQQATDKHIRRDTNTCTRTGGIHAKVSERDSASQV